MAIDHRMAPLTDLVGELVQDVAGQRAGTLVDLVLEQGSGAVAYALVKLPHEADDRLVPVPWRALVVDRSRKAVLLHIALSHLCAAPGLDAARAHALDPAALDAYVRAHYGETPYW
jgi:sporulation protein YlmC with PRC-barrel domain